MKPLDWLAQVRQTHPQSTAHFVAEESYAVLQNTLPGAPRTPRPGRHHPQGQQPRPHRIHPRAQVHYCIRYAPS
eukprot:6491139-Amphidinium_carterae.1